ncbi:hypothetical protein [Fibrella forsythiae]|uniref:Response regulatory domain-containing protein n=1 Tax=Fibrella forsythiae TaxID=2817061 RepID=A0ABS3JDT3_9BACT|nr:hypothetical protein [Fibrella forsythiae]MBO0948165.1 hypothetical protein [Fibrella forsythiae]
MATALLYVNQCSSKPGEFPQFMFLGSDLILSGGGLVAALKKRYPNLLLIILCESQQADQAYQAGANCLLPRPATLPDWEELFEKIEGFWFGVARWPLPQ